MLVILLFSVQSRAASLYVFFPTTVRAKLVQEYIDETCANMEVTVFGRQRDFSNQVSRVPPDAILSVPVVVKSFKSYTPLLVAKNNGELTQDYFLVSVNEAIDVGSLAGKRVGAVDLLGAKAMQSHINTVLATDVKVKRVTKLEDLLPLISFSAVDTLFISERSLEFIRGKTAMDLKVVPSNIKQAIATVAFAANGSEDFKQLTRECITSFGSQINEVLGVDEWK